MAAVLLLLRWLLQLQLLVMMVIVIIKAEQAVLRLIAFVGGSE